MLPLIASLSDVIRLVCDNRACNLSDVSPWHLKAFLVAHYIGCARNSLKSKLSSTTEPSVTVSGSVHL
jgi:hypothetical protein